MAKRPISFIIAVTFTVTAVTRDSLALRPVAYRGQVSSNGAADSVYVVSGKETLSLRDEVETSFSILLKEFQSDEAMTDKEKRELVNAVCKTIHFVSPYFLRLSYRILYHSPIFEIASFSAILAMLYIIYDNSPVLGIIFALSSLLVVGIEFIKAGHGLRAIPSYLAQRPIIITFAALPTFIYLFFTFAPVLYLLAVYVLALIVYVMAKSQGMSSDKKTTAGHFWDRMINSEERSEAELELMLHSTQAIYFDDWKQLYLRESISRDDFHSIVAYLFLNKIISSNIESQNSEFRLRNLMKKRIFEGVYIFYNNSEEQDGESSPKWIRRSKKRLWTKEIDSIEGALNSPTFKRDQRYLKERLSPPHSGSIRPVEIDAINAAA